MDSSAIMTKSCNICLESDTNSIKPDLNENDK